MSKCHIVGNHMSWLNYLTNFISLQIYKGYVDDPRNTDNSWMETKAINFHDEEGTSVGAFPLQAGKVSPLYVLCY